MNPFDSIQATAFKTVASTFGYAATWTPSTGGEQKSATVLYKDATEKTGLSNVDFENERYQMEYQKGDFEGLKEAVAIGENEKVFIQTTETDNLQFWVKRTEKKFDGKTIIAFLIPV